MYLLACLCLSRLNSRARSRGGGARGGAEQRRGEVGPAVWIALVPELNSQGKPLTEVVPQVVSELNTS